MEWNRWPVYSKERQARVPFSQSNLHAKYGQLDVALALRDQRVLNEAMKVCILKCVQVDMQLYLSKQICANRNGCMNVSLLKQLMINAR